MDEQNGTHTAQPHGSIESQKSVCTSYQEREFFRVIAIRTLTNDEDLNFVYPVDLTPSRVKGFFG